MAIDLDSGGFELLVDVDAGDGSEGFAALASGKCEGRLELADLGCECLGDDELLGFALRTARFEGFDVAEVCLGRLVGLALWDEVVAGVAGADFYDVGFGPRPSIFSLRMTCALAMSRESLIEKRAADLGSAGG